MELVSLIGSATTVISFVVFAGVLVWAFSRRQAERFERAAQAPFAVPDEQFDVGREDGRKDAR